MVTSSHVDFRHLQNKREMVYGATEGGALVLYGLKVEYVLWVSLVIVMGWDIMRLRAPAIFIEIPLLIALFYHFQHDSLKLAAVALIFPFIFHLIDLVRGRIAFYDLLAMGMVGAVMGWPYGALTVLLAKASFWFRGIIWIARLFSRKRGEGYYVFPYVVSIVAGAVLTKYFFASLPKVESFLYSLHPERLITLAWFRH
jgi:hypothetical protein